MYSVNWRVDTGKAGKETGVCQSLHLKSKAGLEQLKAWNIRDTVLFLLQVASKKEVDIFLI